MKRVWLIGPFVVVISLAFTAGVAEVILTLVDYPKDRWSPWVQTDHTGHAYAPNLSQRWTTSEFDITWKTNNLGFRDDEVGPKDGLRVLVLGDSFTAGYGVERNELFTSALEDRLGVDIVNAGTGGWDLDHQYHFFRTKGRDLEPDVVLYAMYLGNDLINNGRRRQNDKGIAPDPKYPKLRERDFKLHLLWRQAVHAWEYRHISQRNEWFPSPAYLALCRPILSERARADYSSSSYYLQRLRDEVADAGSTLVVAMFSYRTLVEKRAREDFVAAHPYFDLERPHNEMGKALEELGIEHLNLNPTLMGADAASEGPLYYMIDGHWTPRGHAVVGEALADWLGSGNVSDSLQSAQ